MGDAADDIFNTHFDWDSDVQGALASMSEECRQEHGDCPRRKTEVVWNDDGLLECTVCRRMVDI